MEQLTKGTAAHDTAAFFALINHPVKLKLYLLKSLPAAYFSGLKIRDALPECCTVSVPLKWFTKNPFRSTYFACLCMAAELSTGILAMAQVYKRKPSISMLVTGVEAKFFKKATGLTFFTCNDGEKFIETINNAIAAGQPQQLTVNSVGKNEAGETLADFRITWSFKAK